MFSRISIKEYVDAIFAARDENLHAALAANEKRLDGMNEFRDTLKNQQGTFVTRTELFAWIGVASVIGGALGHIWK